MMLVLSRVYFERTVRVTELHDLLQVDRQESGYRTRLLVLEYVAEFVRQEAPRVVAAHDVYRVSQRKPRHTRTEQSSLNGCCMERRIGRHRQGIDEGDSDEPGIRDADAAGDVLARSGQ